MFLAEAKSYDKKFGWIRGKRSFKVYPKAFDHTEKKDEFVINNDRYEAFVDKRQYLNTMYLGMGSTDLRPSDKIPYRQGICTISSSIVDPRDSTKSLGAHTHHFFLKTRKTLYSILAEWKSVEQALKEANTDTLVVEYTVKYKVIKSNTKPDPQSVPLTEAEQNELLRLKNELARAKDRLENEIKDTDSAYGDERLQDMTDLVLHRLAELGLLPKSFTPRSEEEIREQLTRSSSQPNNPI